MAIQVDDAYILSEHGHRVTGGRCLRIMLHPDTVTCVKKFQQTCCPEASEETL